MVPSVQIGALPDRATCEPRLTPATVGDVVRHRSHRHLRNPNISPFPLLSYQIIGTVPPTELVYDPPTGVLDFTTTTIPMETTTSIIEIVCKDGITLRGKRYSTDSVGSSLAGIPKYRILCLHGWMDNVNTFWKLCPTLLEGLTSSSSSAEIVAFDLPGHGKSAHKSLDGPPMLLMDYVYYVHEIVMGLDWKPEDVTLIGHSMGGSISLMYAAAFPTCHLIMLDSLGPHLREGGAVQHLRAHIKARLRGKDPQSIYESMEHAIEIRMLSATTFPGEQYISKEAATQLVQGATIQLEDGCGVKFLHDQRLKMPNIAYLSQEQVDEFYRAVSGTITSSSSSSFSTQTCLLLADEGMPFPSSMREHTIDVLQPKTVLHLPGSHHFHADPDSAAAVAEAILSFIMVLA